MLRNNKSNILSTFLAYDQVPMAGYTLKWVVIASIIGAFSGSASALFLFMLEWATEWREAHRWVFAFLPLGGLVIGFMYHYLGKEVEAGSNLLIDQVHNPNKVIPFKMAPLVLLGTLITHVFGGSAGREGTAVQMGGSIADQLNHLIKFRPRDRMVLLVCGISAGFASVFGTPLAGALFGLEVFFIGRLRYSAIFPGFVAAIAGNYVCDLWNVQHTRYAIDVVPEMNGYTLLYSILAGIAFGLVSTCFIKLTHYIGTFARSKISYPPFRPLAGGIMVALGVYLIGTTKYVGLGIPTITASFHEQLPVYDFFLKMVFTAITLGFAFKGGEVTPLFFIGATLGNALSYFIPLPMALLSGMGFVAVFSGAANTPLSTIFMAIELFGMQIGMYAGIACVVAYLFSGHSGIYTSQIVGDSKHLWFGREQGFKISAIGEIRRKIQQRKK